MIQKNIILENILINSVFKVISKLNCLLKHKQDKILLYANNGFRDNIFYLYNYLIEYGYNNKFDIVVAIPEYKEYRVNKTNNVRFVSQIDGIVNYLNSGHIYYCYGRIPIIPAKDQITIQMWHGISFKGFDQGTIKTNTEKNQFYTYVFSSSEYFIPIVQKKFSCLPDRVFLCGHPRTDVMYHELPDYGFSQFNKVIIWLPTFRKSKILGYTDTESNKIVPFMDYEDLLNLDTYIEKSGIKLIIKLHKGQDTSKLPAMNFKAIEFYTADSFAEKKYDLYKLLPQTDALITDYSSVFYDYLLLNKPIGFTEDDIDEYRRNRGFAVDDPDKFRPGKKIRSLQQLYEFIEDVEAERDMFREEREEINSIVNKYTDGMNCMRALQASHICI